MKTYENPNLCRDQRYDGMTRPIVIERVCDSYMIQQMNGGGFRYGGFSNWQGYKKNTTPTSYRGNI